MKVKGLGEIKAVAFDIDGTLYPQWRIHFISILHYLAHPLFFLHYGLVRSEMHKMGVLPNFREVQAQKMAVHLRCTPQEAETILEKIVYKGLEKNFLHIPCYKDVLDTFKKFKEAGLKLALLSDFPPEQKGEIWGTKACCDVVLGSEAAGALKPSPHSLLKMAKLLAVDPCEVLYVGNSIAYDVKGAKNAGMKSAFLMTGLRKIFNKPLKEADISFSSYRQLQDIVLKCE